MRTIDIRNWTGTKILVDPSDTDTGEPSTLTVEGIVADRECELCGAHEGVTPDNPVWMTRDLDDKTRRSEFTQCSDCLATALDVSLSGRTSDVWLLPATEVRALINRR